MPIDPPGLIGVGHSYQIQVNLPPESDALKYLKQLSSPDHKSRNYSLTESQILEMGNKVLEDRIEQRIQKTKDKLYRRIQDQMTEDELNRLNASNGNWDDLAKSSSTKKDNCSLLASLWWAFGR